MTQPLFRPLCASCLRSSSASAVCMKKATVRVRLQAWHWGQDKRCRPVSPVSASVPISCDTHHFLFRFTRLGCLGQSTSNVEVSVQAIAQVLMQKGAEHYRPARPAPTPGIGCRKQIGRTCPDKRKLSQSSSYVLHSQQCTAHKPQRHGPLLPLLLLESRISQCQLKAFLLHPPAPGHLVFIDGTVHSHTILCRAGNPATKFNFSAMKDLRKQSRAIAPPLPFYLNLCLVVRLPSQETKAEQLLLRCLFLLHLILCLVVRHRLPVLPDLPAPNACLGLPSSLRGGYHGIGSWASHICRAHLGLCSFHELVLRCLLHQLHESRSLRCREVRHCGEKSHRDESKASSFFEQ